MLCLTFPATLALAAPAAAQAPAPDRVSFGLNLRAEAEYGGYYLAVATRPDARHGVQVAIWQGGPQVNQA